jgi:transketolase
MPREAEARTYGRSLSAAEVEELAVNTIRTMADAAFVLWTKFLRHSPSQPEWPDRDRFVLSAGHGSMLLYSLLHLFGYPVTLEDLKSFRQWGSCTPGHPERCPEHGIETTTGPLGQGFGNGVGMALAERMLANAYNSGNDIILDHYTYGIVSDGDLMEGISHEAASLAGHLKLGRLIYLYDDNEISIEGSTDLAFTEDVGKRFEAYGWQVLRVDGHDRGAVAEAIAQAQEERERPSLIVCRTHIAKGSPNKQDTAASHGEPLGEEEVKATKEALGWPLAPAFFVPEVVRELFAARRKELDREAEAWQQRFGRWRQAHPELAERWKRQVEGAIPEGLEKRLPQYESGKEGGPRSSGSAAEVATRNASGDVLQVLSAELPGLVGGSADLAPSTKTLVKAERDCQHGCYTGRNLRFGVREHAMGAMMNGMSLHGGFIPYGGTFLVFADYMRPAIRLAAMMGRQVVYVFTHDSVFVGEDGPTHQPVEQAMSLRAIPGLVVIRPADAAETAVAWMVALERRENPTALLLTRQNVPVLDRGELAPAEMLRRGGYVLLEAADPEMILIATGSEVHVAVGAARLLAAEGRRVRVVNMASWELFDEQAEEYRRSVLPPEVGKRMSVEAGITMGWERYVGLQGLKQGIDHFGASAPWKVIAEKWGFTAEGVAERARGLLGKL